MEHQRAEDAAPASQADAVPIAEPGGGSPQSPEAGDGLARDRGADADAAPPDGDGDADPAPDAAPPDGDGDAAPAPDAASPAGIAEQEQEALWAGARARAWHERTWLRVLIVLAAIAGIAAIIPYPFRVTAECTLLPGERAKVRSELPGALSEILVDEGHAVNKGDVIARIDDRALQAERLKALAEVEIATARQGNRPEELPQQAAGLKRARAELAYVDERLAMTLVRAPIAGEILTPRLRERIHEAVEAGGLVCEIANTRRMRAEIFVPEREVDAIALGMPAVVKVESYPTHPFAGKVDFIAPTVDGETKRVRVVVELDNPAGLLKANMTGYGEVEAGKRSLLSLATRRVLRWIRVRFLI